MFGWEIRKRYKLNRKKLSREEKRQGNYEAIQKEYNVKNQRGKRKGSEIRKRQKETEGKKQ